MVALVESAYRGEASRAGWTTEADLLEGQRTDAEAVAAMVDHLTVYEEGGALVACYQLERRESGAYFGMFCVRPGIQGRGLGRRVLADAERAARDHWQASELRMTVIRQRTDLIGWYERLGYARTGETIPFPYGDERFGRPTRPDLEFVVLAKKLET